MSKVGHIWVEDSSQESLLIVITLLPHLNTSIFKCKIKFQLQFLNLVENVRLRTSSLRSKVRKKQSCWQCHVYLPFFWINISALFMVKRCYGCYQAWSPSSSSNPEPLSARQSSRSGTTINTELLRIHPFPWVMRVVVVANVPLGCWNPKSLLLL